MPYPVHFHFHGKILVLDFTYPSSTQLLVYAEMLVAKEGELYQAVRQGRVAMIGVGGGAIDMEDDAVGKDIHAILIEDGWVERCGLTMLDASVLLGKGSVDSLVNDVVETETLHNVYLATGWPWSVVEGHQPDGWPCPLGTLKSRPYQESGPFAAAGEGMSVARPYPPSKVGYIVLIPMVIDYAS